MAPSGSFPMGCTIGLKDEFIRSQCRLQRTGGAPGAIPPGRNFVHATNRDLRDERRTASRDLRAKFPGNCAIIQANEQSSAGVLDLVTPGREADKKKSGNGFVWALIGVLLLAVAAMGWAIYGPSVPWNPPPQIKTEVNPVPATPESLTAAEFIYKLRCAHCHGDSGDGSGPEARRLSVQPTDFTDGLAMKKVTDGELFWRIGAGRRPMPSFAKKLTEQERWELVNYIRTLAPRLPTQR